MLAALHGGEGGRIEVPLLDSGLAGLVNVAQNALVTGIEPGRFGNAHPNIVPYQDFETGSGRIAVAAANDGLYRALCTAIGLPELGEDERFRTNAARVENRAELIPQLEARFRERSAEEWLPSLDAAGVPCGKVRSVTDALEAAADSGRAGDDAGRAPRRRAARARGVADLGSRRPGVVAPAAAPRGAHGRGAARARQVG